jgi:hypothetical protein
MKLRTTALALLAVGASLAYAGSAFAQACPGTLTGEITNAALSGSGNNCNNNLNFTAICGNSESLGGGGMDIWSVTVAAGYSGTISINTTAFTPEMGVIGAPCSSSTACLIDETVAAAGNVGPIAFSSAGGGTYYIFVANVADAACGNYNLVMTGPLPVKLQNFSVN